jgi:hypothetical protein
MRGIKHNDLVYFKGREFAVVAWETNEHNVIERILLTDPNRVFDSEWCFWATEDEITPVHHLDS